MKGNATMTKQLSLLMILTMTLLATTAFAFTAPPAPANGWYVLDQTGRMTADQIDQLNHKVKRVSDATHNEFAVVLLQSLDGDTIEDAAYGIFNSWGIGKHGLDNGILIVLSLKDHKSRIETGKGVGGEITDLQSKAILDGMRPQLRAGNFYGAFDQALDQVSSLLESRANQTATPKVQPSSDQTPVDDGIGLIILFIAVGGIGGFGILMWFLSRRRREQDERFSSYSSPPTYETPVIVPIVEPVQMRSQRKRREEERKESSSSTSSSTYESTPSPSYDSGSSSGGFDSGGGFGGGGSDGGGSSSSW